MKGSIRKRGATWSYIVDIGKVDGKRRQKEKGGFRTQKMAQAALNEAINELNKTGFVFELKPKTFDEVFNEFANGEATITRSYSTIVRYKSLYKNHVYDIFGSRYIHTIQANDLQVFIVQKTKDYSEEYSKSIYNFLKVVFSYAKKMKYIKINEMDNVSPPKNSRGNDEVCIYTVNELNKLMDRLKTTNLLTAIMIAVYLGTRAGECYALRWCDVDLDKKQVVIDKQLQSRDGKWGFAELKTSKSYRTITFGTNLYEYLLKIKEEQEQNKKHLGELYKANKLIDFRTKEETIIEVDDLLNVKPDGEMLNANSHKVVSRIVKQENLLDSDFRFHSLRHTHATMLLESGINPKYIQERLGHSKLEFTLRLYTHVTRKMELGAANALDEMFK